MHSAYLLSSKFRILVYFGRQLHLRFNWTVRNVKSWVALRWDIFTELELEETESH